MAGENEVGVKITATSEVAAGVEQAKGSIQGLAGFVAEVRAGFANLGAQIDELKAQFASFGATAEGAMHGAKAATEAESGALTGMVLKVHEGAEAIRTMQMRAKEFAEIYAGIFLVGEVKQFIGSMAEAAEKVDHLHQRMGLTVSQVQALQGVAAGTGMSIDTLAKGLQMMDNRAVTSAGATSAAAKAFQYLGISANDGRSNMERLLVAADKFKSIPDGPDKAALAMQSFGRAGAELIPILDLGSQGIQALMDKTKEYGGINADAEEKGKKLAEAVNEDDIAWQGLKTTLMDALAPSLTSIAEGFSALVARMTTSYQAGGAVKQAFDGIVAAGKSIGQVLGAIAPVFEALATHIKQVTTALEALALVMVSRYVAGAVAASVASGALSTVIFAVTAAAGGAATALEALGFVAAATGRALLAAFGGPVGIAIAAVTLAIYACTDATNGAVTASGKYADALDEEKKSADADRDAIDKLAVAQGKDREEAEAAVQAHLRAAEAKLKDAESSLALAKAEGQRRLGKLQEADAAISPQVVPEVGASVQNLPNPSMALRRAYQQQIADVQTGQQTVDGYQKSIDKLKGALAAPPPTFGGPDITPTHKGKKEKDDLVQRMDEELKAREVAFEMQQAQEGTAHQFSLQEVASYWSKALAMDNLSTKDRLAISERYLAAQKELTDQEIAKTMEGFREKEAEAKDDYAKRIGLAEQEVAYIKRMRGEDSRDYEAAMKHLVEVRRQAAEEEKRIEQEKFRAIEQLRLGEIQVAANTNRFLEQMGVISAAEAIRREADTESQIYGAHRRRIESDLALEREGTKQWMKLKDEEKVLDQQHEAALTALKQRAVLQRTAIERQAINQLSSSWGQALGQLVTLQQGFAATIRSLFQGVQQAVGNAISSIIQNWLTQHLSALLVGKAAEKAAAVSNITTSAAEAGAAGVASYAAAPWPIDMGAPAFGAAMSANAMGYISMAGFDTGAWNVSKDQIAMVHSGETIIPAAEAGGWRALMSAVAGYGLPSAVRAGYSPASNVNAPRPANDGAAGGQHFHYHDHSGRLTSDQIRANKGAFVSMLREAHREFAMTPGRGPGGRR